MPELQRYKYVSTFKSKTFLLKVSMVKILNDVPIQAVALGRDGLSYPPLSNCIVPR